MKSKIFLKLAVSITIIIFIIEGLLLVFSLQNKQKQLLSLQKLEYSIYTSNNIFTTEYINKEVSKFRLNISLLTLLISILVVLSFSIVYQKLIGQFLDKMTQLNRELSNTHTRTSFKVIPKDEIGELIESRFELLSHLESQINQNKKLTRILSHDLNNSLAVILASLAHMQRKGISIEDDDYIDGLKRIKRAAQSQKDLLKKVVEIDALTSQKKELSVEPVLFSDILSDSNFIFEEKLNKKGISLKSNNKDTADFKIFVDRTLFLNNVLNNLISNSIKFSHQGGQIIITTQTDSGGKKIITFQDQGVGISNALIENIFSPYEKTNSLGTEGEKGTGFGMPLVKESITSLGGDIEVKSKCQNKFPDESGTMFIITLPREETRVPRSE